MADDFEEEFEDEEGEDGEGGGGGKGKLLIIIIAAVVLLGGGAAAYFFFFAGGDEPAVTEGGEGGPKVEGQETAGEGGGGGGEGAEGEKQSTVYPLDPFIVNLADPVGNRYLKVKLALQLESTMLQAEVEMKIAQVRDAFLLLLSSKSLAQINSTEGKLKLRSELMHRVNQVLKKGRVTTIYFTEFVVQ